MNRLSSAIIQPTIVAIGASIFLLSYNRNLQMEDYFLHLPFWITVVRPSGLFWHSKLLKEVNKGVFPPEMKVYREMYLTSKNAILYDVVLNHTLYHSLLTPLLIVYMYAAKILAQKWKISKNVSSQKQQKELRNSLGDVFKESLATLLKGRVLISCVSIFSEYWITHFSLNRQGSTSTFSLPTNVKRFLMAKQMLLSWSWSGLILREFFRNYHKKNLE